MTGPRVLVIDDEIPIHRFLTPALEAEGFEPIRAVTAAEGLIQLQRRPIPDVVILDLGLPDMDGQEALVKARALYQGPILILSARDRETEKITALDNGADDYVEKPFSVGEFLARMRVAMRNRLRAAGADPVVSAGDLRIDLIKRRVTKAGEPVHLSPREYDLLAEIVKGSGKVLTQRLLLSRVWGPAHADDVQYLRTYMAQLRQKLEPDPTRPRHLVTEAGVGYRFLLDEGLG
jgi:two-component system KDP operon response regulator KdpE